MEAMARLRHDQGRLHGDPENWIPNCAACRENPNTATPRRVFMLLGIRKLDSEITFNAHDYACGHRGTPVDTFRVRQMIQSNIPGMLETVRVKVFLASGDIDIRSGACVHQSYPTPHGAMWISR